MGSAVGVPKKYMVGKQPKKYFTESVVNSIAYLKHLGLTEADNFKLFTIFILFNSSETGETSVPECIDYLRSSNPKLDKRLLISCFDNFNEESTNITFEQFILIVWNICTLTLAQLSQLIWEIYDVNNQGYLYRQDMDTMYRMIYDCDDSDIYEMNQLPFDNIVRKSGKFNMTGSTDIDDQISNSARSNIETNFMTSYYHKKPLKSEEHSENIPNISIRSMEQILNKSHFITYCQDIKKHHFIDPIINFQRSIQNKVGGVTFWKKLQYDRQMTFSDIENEKTPLNVSLQLIINKIIQQEIDEVNTRSLDSADITAPIPLQPIGNLNQENDSSSINKDMNTSVTNTTKVTFNTTTNNNNTITIDTAAATSSNTLSKTVKKDKSILNQQSLRDEHYTSYEKSKEKLLQVTESIMNNLHNESQDAENALMKLNENITTFIETDYSIHDIYQCHTDRLHLYHCYDDWMEKTEKYYQLLDESELNYAIGTTLDHEARYQDFIQTDEGKMIRRLYTLEILLNELIIEKNNILKGLPPSGTQSSSNNNYSNNNNSSSRALTSTNSINSNQPSGIHADTSTNVHMALQSSHLMFASTRSHDYVDASPHTPYNDHMSISKRNLDDPDELDGEDDDKSDSVYTSHTPKALHTSAIYRDDQSITSHASYQPAGASVLSSVSAGSSNSSYSSSINSLLPKTIVNMRISQDIVHLTAALHTVTTAIENYCKKEQSAYESIMDLLRAHVITDDPYSLAITSLSRIIQAEAGISNHMNRISFTKNKGSLITNITQEKNTLSNTGGTTNTLDVLIDKNNNSKSNTASDTSSMNSRLGLRLMSTFLNDAKMTITRTNSGHFNRNSTKDSTDVNKGIKSSFIDKITADDTQSISSDVQSMSRSSVLSSVQSGVSGNRQQHHHHHTTSKSTKKKTSSKPPLDILYTKEMKLVQSMRNKGQIDMAQHMIDVKLEAVIRDNYIHRIEGEIEARRDGRLLYYNEKEQEMIHRLGNRTSKWERVRELLSDSLVLMNVDTQAVVPKNTVICTKCDHVIEAFLTQCKFCETDASDTDLLDTM